MFMVSANSILKDSFSVTCKRKCCVSHWIVKECDDYI